MKWIVVLIISLTSLRCFGQSKTPRYRQSISSDFTELDSSSLVVIPIKWDDNDKVGGTKIDYYRGIKNVLFYDPETDYTKFLFDDSVQVIKRYEGYLLNHHDDENLGRAKNKGDIYYSVINEDYNQDQKLDSEDLTYLYMSKFDGRG